MPRLKTGMYRIANFTGYPILPHTGLLYPLDTGYISYDIVMEQVLLCGVQWRFLVVNCSVNHGQIYKQNIKILNCCLYMFAFHINVIPCWSESPMEYFN
jgi:hypothetical protein